MGITKKTEAEIETLQAAGHILATILHTLADEAVEGTSTEALDDRAMDMVETYGVEPILLGYKPDFAPFPYPAATCISVNDRVQHGIPSASEILAAGDVVNLDMSIGYEGMVVDAGITVGVGEVTKAAASLIAHTQEALAHGIKAAQPGNHIGDISHAIQSFIESRGLSVVKELCGHGVGYAVHEEPSITNFGRPATGPKIEVGHVYAIEPIVTTGSGKVYFDDDGDGYSVYSADGSLSAQFEHSVAITAAGPQILTKRR